MYGHGVPTLLAPLLLLLLPAALGASQGQAAQAYAGAQRGARPAVAIREHTVSG